MLMQVDSFQIKFCQEDGVSHSNRSVSERAVRGTLFKSLFFVERSPSLSGEQLHPPNCPAHYYCPRCKYITFVFLIVVRLIR